MTPLQFVTRQRIARAQQLIRETSRSQIESALEVGYTSPSHFAQVFRRETGLYAERLPAAALKKGNVRKSCEFTARAAPSFTQEPDFSGVFVRDTSGGKLKTKGT
jgi:AraC-like DNA-binding protein